jgi:hypothetical protein
MERKLGKAKTGTKVHARPADGSMSLCGVRLAYSVPVKSDAPKGSREEWITLWEAVERRGGIPCEKCYRAEYFNSLLGR